MRTGERGRKGEKEREEGSEGERRRKEGGVMT